MAAANISQSSSNNLIYAAKMVVATEPVTVNNVTFTLSGTHDANDLTTVLVYFNATSPVFSGSTFLGSAAATFAAPHAYSIAVSKAMAVNTSGYFLILGNVSSTGTLNNTVKLNGSTTPVVFGFTTTPNIVNSQTDAAGIRTIRSLVARQADSTIPDAVLYDANDRQKNINLTDEQLLSKLKASVSLYPNPALRNSQVTLTLKNLPKNAYTITVFDLRGQQVMNQVFDHAGGNSLQKLSLPQIAPGIYIIEIQSGNVKFAERLSVR